MNCDIFRTLRSEIGQVKSTTLGERQRIAGSVNKFVRFDDIYKTILNIIM